MEDAVRPSESEMKAMYERGYKIWATLWEEARTEKNDVMSYFQDLTSIFTDHPSFPPDLAIDRSGRDPVAAKGTVTWGTTCEGDCDLESFDEELVFKLAVKSATEVTLMPESSPAPEYLEQICGGKRNHVSILILAWAYILSARWAELIPEVEGPVYNPTADQELRDEESPRGDEVIVLDIGDADQDAARWWEAVLSTGCGWSASIEDKDGIALVSPWAVKFQPDVSLAVSAKTPTQAPLTDLAPPSFRAALGYLSDYCSYHGVVNQSQPALAAAMMIPVAEQERRIIQLPRPQTPGRPNIEREPQQQGNSAWQGDVDQFDRLLTLSCNALGVKSLLASIFYEPGIACNICGAYMRGSFAFLNASRDEDPHLQLLTFMKRDLGLASLWLGAFMTDAHTRCLKEGREGWWRVNLSVGAWTDTYVSFMLDAVQPTPAEANSISRADESRLIYLTHESNYDKTPLFPWMPFGSIAEEDTDLDVRGHIHCGSTHELIYESVTWNCNGGRKHVQRPRQAKSRAYRPKATLLPQDAESSIIEAPPHDRATEEGNSSMVTMSVFEWLRAHAGWPVAERPIRQHEWISRFAAYDGGPGRPSRGMRGNDARSTIDDGRLGKWFLGVYGADHSATI